MKSETFASSNSNAGVRESHDGRRLKELSHFHTQFHRYKFKRERMPTNVGNVYTVRITLAGVTIHQTHNPLVDNGQIKTQNSFGGGGFGKTRKPINPPTPPLHTASPGCVSSFTRGKAAAGGGNILSTSSSRKRRRSANNVFISPCAHATTRKLYSYLKIVFNARRWRGKVYSERVAGGG